MLRIVTKVRLVSKETDSLGYTTYVFFILEADDRKRLNSNYIMCTRWPHWDHRSIKIYEEGYVSVTEVRAGIDEWFDGVGFVKYRYSTTQFDRFVNVQPDNKKEIKL